MDYLPNLILSLGIFIIYQAILFTNSFFPRLHAILQEWRHTKFHVIRLKKMEILTPDQITDFLLSLARYVQNGITLLLAMTGMTYILSFFPGTQNFALHIIDITGEILTTFGNAILGFLPNILMLLFIITTTYYALKLLNFFYEGVLNNRIRIFGLHKELAEPTYQLLRFFIITLALVAAYPYFPGSNSRSFAALLFLRVSCFRWGPLPWSQISYPALY